MLFTGYSSPAGDCSRYLDCPAWYCCWWDGRPLLCAPCNPPVCPWQNCSRRMVCLSSVLASSSRESTADGRRGRTRQPLSECKIPVMSVMSTQNEYQWLSNLKMLFIDSTLLRGASIVFLLQLLLLQVGLDVHPHPPLLLPLGGILICIPVVEGEILKENDYEYE